MGWGQIRTFTSDGPGDLSSGSLISADPLVGEQQAPLSKVESRPALSW